MHLHAVTHRWLEEEEGPTEPTTANEALSGGVKAADTWSKNQSLAHDGG
jgi:hypothetical protein